MGDAMGSPEQRHLTTHVDAALAFGARRPPHWCPQRWKHVVLDQDTSFLVDRELAFLIEVVSQHYAVGGAMSYAVGDAMGDAMESLGRWNPWCERSNQGGAGRVEQEPQHREFAQVWVPM